MKEATITPFAKPLYIMTKPVGAVCNLACDYSATGSIKSSLSD